jgi:hypothetical protein
VIGGGVGHLISTNGDYGVISVDADGVSLAAIQGLNQKLEEKNARIRSWNTIGKIRTVVRGKTATKNPRNAHCHWTFVQVD